LTKDAPEAGDWYPDMGENNLAPYTRVELVLKLEPLLRAKAEANLHLSKGRGQKGVQNSAQVKAEDRKTRQKLATIAGVSHDTIAKGKPISTPVACAGVAYSEPGHPARIDFILPSENHATNGPWRGRSALDGCQQNLATAKGQRPTDSLRPSSCQISCQIACFRCFSSHAVARQTQVSRARQPR